jgi:shikimate dehydrogenase
MTDRYALAGWPLGHSLSPAIHNAAFRALGLDAEYRLLPIPPGELATLDVALRSGRLQGANVTVPHKRAVVPLMDELTEVARVTGAVNTVAVVAAGRLLGDNTDVEGFARALGALPELSSPGAAVVFGAGGAARAVVHVLLGLGWDVTVLSRTAPALGELARDMALTHGARHLEIGPIAAGILRTRLDRIALVVNATPLGSEDVPGSPWPADVPFPREAVVFDLVAWPPVTPLVAAARRAGLTALNGVPMLVLQAAATFERWTGLPAPGGVMRDAALAVVDQSTPTASAPAPAADDDEWEELDGIDGLEPSDRDDRDWDAP